MDVEGRIEVCGREGGSWLSWNLFQERESPEKEDLSHSPIVAELLLGTRQTPLDPFSADALKPLAGQGGPGHGGAHLEGGP